MAETPKGSVSDPDSVRPRSTLPADRFPGATQAMTSVGFLPCVHRKHSHMNNFVERPDPACPLVVKRRERRQPPLYDQVQSCSAFYYQPPRASLRPCNSCPFVVLVCSTTRVVDTLD